MNTISVVSVGALLGAVTSVALAEETIAPVVVTATRTAQTVDESLAAVTVITREEIDRSQASDLRELLAGSTGLDFVSAGGSGKSTSLYLRGTNVGHLLVLVDGVRIGSATLGLADLAQLPLTEIERVEIVRGPRSSLYGSEAIGGVLQVFTRQGGDKQRVHASVGGGSENTKQGSAGISGRSGNTDYSLSVSRNSSDGIDVTGSPGYEDTDGYLNSSAALRLGQRIGTARLELNLLHSDGNIDTDNTRSDIIYSTQQTAGVTLTANPHDIWSLTLRAGEHRDEQKTYLASVLDSRINTKRRNYTWQNDIALSAADLVSVGVDRQEEKVDSTQDYTRTERANNGLFAQYQTAQSLGDITLSARRDDSDAYGTHDSGNVAYGRDLGAGLRLIASYGTAFRAPTFNDLYWPADPWSSGNPDLKPEESETIELGLRGQHAALQWSLNAYTTTIDNLIDWACTANCGGVWWDDFWQPSNVSRARIDGVEGRIALTPAQNWRASVQFTFLDPRDEITNNVLANRSRDYAKLEVERQLTQTLLGLEFVNFGPRYADAANTTELDGYRLLNLRASYQIDPAWSLRARIDNALDAEYRSLESFLMPGRTWLLSARYATP